VPRPRPRARDSLRVWLLGEFWFSFPAGKARGLGVLVVEVEVEVEL
jgi:hypothetical protein